MVTHSVPFSDCDSLVQIITAVTTGEVRVQLLRDELLISYNNDDIKYSVLRYQRVVQIF